MSDRVTVYQPFRSRRGLFTMSDYYLQNLIDLLAAEPDQDRIVGDAFGHPHSYRGYYEDLAFEVAHNRTVGQMLTDARSAIGQTFTGWKGGDFTMHGYSYVWIVEHEGETGESLGPRLLRYMLATSPTCTRRSDG